ncbi:MAG TPA: hypothetical protein DCG12_17310 [Planctomycetaceae bacterium]|nr:hypothetical protein [Planctomycetaceae bacterium]
MIMQLSNFGKLLICSCVLLTSAAADEPALKFLEGLRQRRYFDTALEYIDQLEGRSDLPQEVTKVLDLERGITLRAQATASAYSDDKEQALARAEQALKKFATENADHPRAAFANFEVGQLLLERARSTVWEAESPAAASRKNELLQSARGLIDQAKGIYQVAFDQYSALNDKYPAFIDRDEEPDLFQERNQVLLRKLRSQYQLARCTYERGQTFEMGSQERNETLIRASSEFEKIYQENRSTPLGRLSNLMRGKCFQEQGDIGRAVSFYNDVKDDRSNQPAVVQLRAYAVQFRLICLNHETRNDYQLVVTEATEWLADNVNRPLLGTEQGIGIKWERALAYEKMSAEREIEEKARNQLLNAAFDDADQVSQVGGRYYEPALEMKRRIGALRGDRSKEPTDALSAYDAAKAILTSDYRKAVDALKTAKDSGDQTAIQSATQTLNLNLKELGRLLQLTLKLRDRDTDPKLVASARNLLSFVYLKQNKNLDAVILARFCMEKDRAVNPEAALEAVDIAMAAVVRAYNEAGEDKDFEIQLMKEVMELIISDYDKSAKGNEARFRLAKIYGDLGDPETSAATYLTVAPEYKLYPTAQIKAGQAYLTSWYNGLIAAGGESEAGNLTELRDNAAKYLRTGLKLARANLGDGRPGAEVVKAEISLADINNRQGNFQETIARLTAGAANSVLAIQQLPADQRPATGVGSTALAAQTYRYMLRAYIGTQQLEKALEIMTSLENVGEQNLAAVYTELGKQLESELEGLKAAGDTEKLDQARTDFESFLDRVRERDQLDYNSLLWIGETYLGLGNGVRDQREVAEPYFARAAEAFQQMLDEKLVEKQFVNAIKLRLVKCRTAQRKYQEAVSMAQEILTESEMLLEGQFEAAHSLAEWGADAGGEPDKLLEAIGGIKVGEKRVIWGYGYLARRLAQTRNQPEWEQLRPQFLDARYEIANSRLRYFQTGAADGKQMLDTAAGELRLFASRTSDLSDVEFDRFSGLYDTIVAELGMGNNDKHYTLKRFEKVEVPPEQMVARTEEEIAKDKAEDPVPTYEPEGPGVAFFGVALLLAGGLGFGCYKMMSKPPQRKRAYSSDVNVKADAAGPPVSMPSGDGEPSFEGLDIGPPPGPPGTAPQKRRKKKGAPKAGPGGKTPAKKKRPMTPEQMEQAKARRRRAAKEKAAQEQGEGGPRPKKKARKRPPQPPADEK